MHHGNVQFLHPDKVLAQLDLRPGMRIGDFGCGHGYFSIPLAKVLGENGRLYAVDVQDQALEVVKDKAVLEGLANIETIRADLEKINTSKIADGSLEMVFLANALFQSQKKEQVIAEAKRTLKDQGQLVIIDWLLEAPLAPKEGWLIGQDEASNLAEMQGFKFIKEIEVDQQHFGLLLSKR